MKITNISAHLMGVPGAGGHSPRRNWTFVRVETDAGIDGVGEATTEYHEHAVAAMIEEHMAPALLGQDPTQVNSAWQLMQRGFWWRSGVVASSAASGIEQALWDITGKAYSQPVYKLLGGALRDKIRLYARSDLGLTSIGEEVRVALAEGFSAFKFGPGENVKPYDGEKQVNVALQQARAAREAGPECELMIDCGGIFTLQEACRLTSGLQEVGMLFVEEPVCADTPRGLVALRQAFPGMSIASGERFMTRVAFREWFEQGAVDVIQADISHAGGIGELTRIGAVAELYNVRMAPHNPYGPVALAANLHAAAVMQGFLILEHCRHRPWFDEVQEYGPRIADGYAYLPDRPGLGIALDWDYVHKHPYERLPLRLMRNADGSLPSI